MEEIIQALLTIDQKAKEVIKPIEEKRDHQEIWTKQELAVKEAVKELQEKAEIEKQKQKWDQELEEKKKQIELETRQKIEHMQENFKENKERIENQLITEITQGYDQNHRKMG